MDSGNNSASLQSSGCVGGGDEEYDSRASDSFSSAFHTQNSSMFDPFANYFNPISSPHPHPPPPAPSHNYTAPKSLFNLDTDWSKTLRSDQNNSPMVLPLSDTPSSSNNTLSFCTGVSFPSAPAERGGGNVNIVTTTTAGTAVVLPPVDQPVTQPAPNPKKRSRASRRAPTTVLTTDTTNFRAMVQEFTGIPAPPFTSSYFPPRSRFDLFASAPNSSIRSAAASSNPLNISQPPNYLRRPFSQKIQPPPFLSPSSSSSSSSLMLSCLANNIASASSTSTSTNSTINYQLSSELGLLKPQLPSGVTNSVTQSSNLFSAIQQNSILTSLLQSSKKYPIGSKDQEQFQMPSNSSSQLKIGSVLDEYSMNSAQHGHLVSGLPNLISSEQAAASSRKDNSIAANFHGDKVQETVASRGGEGMVESWICSSD